MNKSQSSRIACLLYIHVSSQLPSHARFCPGLLLHHASSQPNCTAQLTLNSCMHISLTQAAHVSSSKRITFQLTSPVTQPSLQSINTSSKPSSRTSRICQAQHAQPTTFSSFHVICPARINPHGAISQPCTYISSIYSLYAQLKHHITSWSFTYRPMTI